MTELHKKTQKITELVLKAADKARNETDFEPEPALTRPIEWPVNCVVGPGLEGAIACASKVGYVNGAKGWLIYRGYDIFDLCANSTYEEVSYLLLHGELPTALQLELFKRKLIVCRKIPNTLRHLVNFSCEKMNAMAALRLGINLMRQEFTSVDGQDYEFELAKVIGTDEDSIPMETYPRGEKKAIYEFKNESGTKGFKSVEKNFKSAIGYESCYRLIAGSAVISAAVSRVKQGHFPIESDSKLSHAANLLYMITGSVPTLEEERVMDILLILHADHGMNASTFASMVVASTLSDIYFSVSSGMAALNGPLHGGANEQVLKMLNEIGSVDNAKKWYGRSIKAKRKIMGFGHRVYKAYDPRARVLSPIAKYVSKNNKKSKVLFKIAQSLEKEVVSSLGKEKKIFPNVDFYSGIVYSSIDILPDMFTSLFAVSRVAGWTARVMEYLENNRIFRPRAMYVGQFNKKYTPRDKRSSKFK